MENHRRFVLAPETPTLSLEQWLTLAEQRFGATARALGEEGVFTQARQILSDGTSAQRQSGWYEASAAPADERWQAVVDGLLAESREGQVVPAS